MQPEYARIAHRAVKLTKLSELYSISLSDESASELAGMIAELPDSELDRINAGTAPIVGCPAMIIPLLAGWSKNCVDCPYLTRVGMGRNDTGNKMGTCALK